MSGFHSPRKTVEPPKPPIDEAAAEQFIRGAVTAITPPSTPEKSGTQAPPETAAKTAPWLGKDNKRRHPAFSARFTEFELAKLKYIADNTPHSMHQFTINAVNAAMDAKLRELGFEFPEQPSTDA